MRTGRFIFYVGLAAVAQAAQVDVASSVRADGAKLAAGATVPGGTELTTGSKARAQLTLGNRGSVVRAGSKTDAFLRENEDTLDLKRGILLASSGRGALGRREAVTVDTKEAVNTAKGTMLVAYQPETYIKVTCIEGKVTVRLKALIGEFVTLTAGQMVIINPAEKRLPEVVEIDLAELSRTSALLGADFPALANLQRIEAAWTAQARDVEKNEVQVTPLLMRGAGTEVVLGQTAGIEAQRELEEPQPQTDRPASDESDSGSTSGAAAPRDFVIDETTTFDPDARTITTPGLGTIQGISTDGGTTYTFPDRNLTLSPELLVTRSVDIPASSNGSDTYFSPGAIGFNGASVVLHGDLGVDAQGPLDVANSTIDENIGDASSGVVAIRLTSESGVTIANSGIRVGQGIQVAGTTPSESAAADGSAAAVVIDNSGLDSRDGSVYVSSSSRNGNQVAIQIRNSSELAALSAQLANIGVQTNGGQIHIGESSLATTGELLIDTANPGVDSLVYLRNVTASADVIRARAFNSGGRDALVIDGGNFNAGRLLRFYAEGASTLRFRGNVALDTPDAILAGRTVEVDRGGNVNIRGRGSIYADFHNYNNNNNVNGTINASSGLTTGGFGSRPGFGANEGN